MNEAVSVTDYLRDPRLAALAPGAMPAWLWNTDATRVLWANPVGAAVLAGKYPTAIGAQISRFSATLPFSGAIRLQRLRGLSAGVGHMLLCACSRIALTDRTAGFLVVAQEPAGPALSLAERVRRLYQSCDQPLAVFTPEGLPLFATAAARALFAETDQLAAIGAERLGREALVLGRAVGSTPFGPVNIERLGRDAATVLVATLLSARAAPVAASADAAAPAAEIVAPLEPAAEQPAAPEPPVVSESVSAEADIIAPPAEAVASAPQIPAQPPIDLDLPPLDLPSAWTTSDLVPPPTSEPPPSPEEPLPREEIVAPAPPAEAVVPSPPVVTEIPVRERRHPLRFVWQMDGDGRFTLGSDEFTEVIGPDAAATLGRRWNEIAAELALDPAGKVARAIASRDTWSGVTVSWPVDGGSERLAIELSGLPIYDRDRVFLGYRGFGVCRDIERLAALATLRRKSEAAAVEDTALRETESKRASPAKIGSTTTGANDDNRPALSVVPVAKNVVPFRAIGAEPKGLLLSPIEHNAFSELARQLTARLQDGAEDLREAAGLEATQLSADDASPTNAAAPFADSPTDDAPAEHTLLERLPVGILVYRLDLLLFGNRTFLDWTGYPSLDALAEAGGLDTLFIEPGTDLLSDTGGHGKALAITTQRGDTLPVEGRLFSVAWEGETALLLMLMLTRGNDRAETPPAPLQAQAEIGALNAMLDATSDAILVLDRDGRILSANRAAGIVFGSGADALTGGFGDLFASDSKRMALERLAEIAHGPASDIAPSACELTGRTRSGNSIPLAMRISALPSDEPRYIVVLQDIAARKRVEDELLIAHRQLQKTSSEKSEFLATISHEIRTPLNSIVGFAEVMLEERFGPIGNERYRDYLKDIRTSGTHVVSMLNDLLDLSKIEAGTLELNFAPTNLNELVQSCVAQMQPQASRERIIIRMSLSPTLPAIVADLRALRQIIVNLLNNSIKFTGAGGQVIVSTAISDARDIVLRVRDTGIGLSATDVAAALAPFRQLATRSALGSAWDSGGSGLGLSLTKALAEANRARFNIVSKIDDGTLVEITFPPMPTVDR